MEYGRVVKVGHAKMSDKHRLVSQDSASCQALPDLERDIPNLSPASTQLPSDPVEDTVGGKPAPSADNTQCDSIKMSLTLKKKKKETITYRLMGPPSTVGSERPPVGSERPPVGSERPPVGSEGITLNCWQ
ncbi:hypothetical protein RRG08_009601 [Elysia crispata]|uniref:Uncharacterized protein n=1 Tax=Elysia crispata TaxID=231223 RepID=A0AAE1CM39_9GAST|nr:hypothetical protein RRG08_009601 [Elysia crispata]